jgi:hypothetical protein
MLLPAAVGGFLSLSQIFITVVAIAFLLRSTYQVYKALMFLQCVALLIEILAYNEPQLLASPREFV